MNSIFQIFVLIIPIVVGFSFDSFDLWKNDDHLPPRKRQTPSSSEENSASSETGSAGWVATNATWYNDQCVDHTLTVDEICDTTFSQRYWDSDQYFNRSAGGPLFVFLGGEGKVAAQANGGAWLDYAKDHGAYTLAIEHRYYGKSWPTPQGQTRKASVMKQLLTSQQALKDYARIITWFKKENNLTDPDSKVVVFGGSYNGFLSAWFRALYPKVAHAAVASSAPMNYTFEFPKYIRKCSEALLSANATCFDTVKSTFACMQQIANNQTCDQTATKDRDAMATQMNMCQDFNTEIDMENFFDGAAAAWTVNWPGTMSVASCEALLSQNSSDILVNYANFITATNMSTPCQSSRKKRQADPISDPGGYNYSWFWQSCNEFVNFMVSDDEYELFGKNTIGINSNVYGCQTWYPDAGWDADAIRANVDATRERYPYDGFNGTCVIFPNGSWDPWGTEGITNPSDTSPNNTVLYYPKGEHCDDMLSPPENQFANTTILQIQQNITQTIGIYLNNIYC